MLGVACAAVVAMPRIVFSSESWAAGGGRHAVVSFHMEQPYLDRTGTALPYHPPCGARSGQDASYLSEEAFRRSFVYV